MRNDRRWLAALARTNTATYGAPTFEESALQQLLHVGPPGIVATAGVVVHQKDVLGHFEPAIPAPAIEALPLGTALDIQRTLRDNRSRKHREKGSARQSPSLHGAQ